MVSKWEPADARKAQGNIGSGSSYTPRYARAPSKFSPKRAVKSFRDLEVYQQTLQCSVVVGKNLMPVLEKAKFPLAEGMRNCALSIPLYVAEAHGMRFSNFELAVATIEKAMQGCNKMIVYLEQWNGLVEGIDAPL